MKVVCNREKLLHAFQTVASVSPARSTKPILQNVKIEVSSEVGRGTTFRVLLPCEEKTA